MNRVCKIFAVIFFLFVLECNAEREELEVVIFNGNDDLEPKVNLKPQSRPSDPKFSGIPKKSCLTANNEKGNCTDFLGCNFRYKAPDFSNNCSIKLANGNTKFGFCCTDPKQLPSVKKPNTRYPFHESWPPPPPPPPPAFPPQHTDNLKPSIQTFPTNFFNNKPSSWPSNIPGLVTTQRPATIWPRSWPINYYPTSAITPADLTTPSSIIPPSSPYPVCGENGRYVRQQDHANIVGGTTSKKSEWPWIAGLFVASRYVCGGSLIDNTHVLTAAHCVIQLTSWHMAQMTVRLGDHDINTPFESYHVEKRIKRIVYHRHFTMATLQNDIAVITLREPVEYNEYVKPICLPTGSNNLYTEKRATVIGWGSLREGGPSPGVLQKVNIQIWSNINCRQKYSRSPYKISDNALCAGDPGRDSCQGDSGGPLMVNEGRWTQVGIVSWGYGCGSGFFPGVYTRVSHYLNWIKSATQASF